MADKSTANQEEAPHYHGHRARLRERFLQKGGGSLADYEVLEMLLFAAKTRGDVKPIAKSLLSHFGDFASLMNASDSELARLDGVGDSVIAAVKIVREAASRMLLSEVKKAPVLQSWQSLLDYCEMRTSNLNKEEFRIFFLDKKNRLIADEQQQTGTVDHTPVYPREVVARALELSASAIIMMHNHPSGDPTPSKADISVTNQIMAALAPVGILLHDHIVIGKGGSHYSFASHGMI